MVEVEELIKKECKRRGYSPRTANSYTYCVNKFLKWCKKEPKKVTKKDVREYIDLLVNKGKTGNTINVYLNSLKFLFEEIMGKKMKLDIRYSKKPVKLPVVLGKEEIKKLFSAIENSKHKLMIKLMYGAGLRVSELINLKINDLEIDKGVGFVRAGKGKKDRLFIIPEILKDELKKFIGNKKMDEFDYLFTSFNGRKYSVRSLQEIIKKARKKAGINKKISCHSLRHSFATHLIEQGNSVQDVQLLLGHKSPETTMVYLHTATNSMLNIKSPIDSF